MINITKKDIIQRSINLFKRKQLKSSADKSIVLYKAHIYKVTLERLFHEKDLLLKNGENDYYYSTILAPNFRNVVIGGVEKEDIDYLSHIQTFAESYVNELCAKTLHMIDNYEIDLSNSVITFNESSNLLYIHHVKDGEKLLLRIAIRNHSRVPCQLSCTLKQF